MGLCILDKWYDEISGYAFIQFSYSDENHPMEIWTTSYCCGWDGYDMFLIPHDDPNYSKYHRAAAAGHKWRDWFPTVEEIAIKAIGRYGSSEDDISVNMCPDEW